MSCLPIDDDLMLWITTLRARLNRGDLAALPPVDIGYGRLPVERTVRIMLAELEDFEEEAHTPVNAARRASLLDDFLLLRSLLG